MGKNVNEGFLHKILNANSFDSWLKGLYGQELTTQKDELKKVFTVTYDNNITSDQKKALDSKAASLEEQVEMLEAKMAVLAEEMVKNEKKIQEHTNDIAEIIQAVAEKSEKMQGMQENWTKKCVKDVFKDYEEGTIGKDAITAEIAVRMKGCPGLRNIKLDIEDLLGDLDGQKNKVSGLVNEATKWIEQKKILEAQYGCTKSAYDLLKVTIGQVGSMGTSYENLDTNKAVPIYSPAKVATVASYLDNPNLNVKGGNSAKVEGHSEPTLESIKEKYAEYLNTEATGNDTNSINNKAVENLGKALTLNPDGTGIVEDLASAGLNYDQVKQFFIDNFKGANIKDSNGKISYPYGHGSKADAIFDLFNEKIKSYNGLLGAKNTWGPYGNTMDSNPQLQKLSEFVAAGNFEKLREQGFTFKEAMYALFRPNDGLFADSGVRYNLDEQGDPPHYFVQCGGDKETADMLKDMTKRIFDCWGVGFIKGADAEKYDVKPVEEPTDPPEDDTNRTDPLSFYLGEDVNNKYSFIMDRDGDGKFTNKEDFVGGKDGTSWLDDLKTFDKDDNDILDETELADVKLLRTKYTDNVNETTDPEGYLRGEETTVGYELKSATEMGIASINLNDLEGAVGQTTEKLDINGNEIFNDSFKMTMRNGSEVEVKRLDETDEFMQAIYGGENGAFGKSFKIGFEKDSAEVTQIIQKDYAEFYEFDERFKRLFDNIAVLQNVDGIANDTRMKYEDVLKLLEEQNLIELTKASNRAAALKEHPSWNRIEMQVLSIATSKGMSVTDADMIQMKGIFMQNGSLSAEGVVEKYQQQRLAEQKINEAKEATKQTWEIMAQCIKNGIIPDVQLIMTELLLEEPKSVEEIIAELKAKMPDIEADVEVDVSTLGFDSEREKAIFDEFNNVFAAAGLGHKVVEALRDLCVAEMNASGGLRNLTAKQLAERFLQKYQEK